MLVKKSCLLSFAPSTLNNILVSTFFAILYALHIPYTTALKGPIVRPSPKTGSRGPGHLRWRHWHCGLRFAPVAVQEPPRPRPQADARPTRGVTGASDFPRRLSAAGHHDRRVGAKCQATSHEGVSGEAFVLMV